MINVCCVYYGNKYKAEYVQKLYNMVKRNLTVPHKFICFTDWKQLWRQVKGDIEFSQNLRTENGADIEGYIKKTASKSKITGDFLFSKSKEEKKTKKNGKPEAATNKESEALI